MTYVLGIDGGGSKSHILLCNDNGETVQFLEWGPTNHETLENGFQSLQIELTAIANHLCKANNISLKDISIAVFGLAGVDTQAQHTVISGILSEVGFRNFLLCNDAYLGLFAGIDKGYGICSVNGTGCTTVGIDPSGQSIQISGQCYLTSDFGGGYMLGIETVASIYRSIYKQGKQTVMKDMIYNELDIFNDDEFMNIVTMKDFTGDFPIKDLNRFVFRAARIGDEVALSLLHRMGDEIGNTILGVLAKLDYPDEPIDIILSGSLYTKEKSENVLERIKNRVTRRSDAILNYIYLSKKPVEGAINLALRSLAGHSILLQTSINY